ncbi:UNVERIFIED_CONTAM: putative peptidoglycan binding protein [Acetivibrio alkalicellulosi]
MFYTEFYYNAQIPRQMHGMTGFSTIYVVRPGDTLFEISRRFNVPIGVIVAINNIENPNVIFPGQRLVIPMIPISPMPPLPVLREGSRGVYVVFLQRLLLANGYNIGIIDGVFDMRIRQAVERVQRDRGFPVTGVVEIQTWRTLMEQAPEIVRPPAFPVIHTVAPGDTLFDIAARYNVSLALLIAVNRIADPNVIYPGMRIIIPLQ